MQIIKASTETAASRRQEEINSWVRKLRERDAADRAKQKEPKRLLYAINYRISDTESEEKGTGDSRRAAIRAIIEALEPRERHISTSTYLVLVSIAKAETLIDLLMPPLDASLDGLHVRQASPTNGASRGQTGFESR